MNVPPNRQPGFTEGEKEVVEKVVANPASRPVTREKRRPFGSQVQKLAYEARTGYHRHWFNDSPGRIEQAKEAGYTPVMDKEGKQVVRVVGTNPAGGALLGYLMEIPQEWYDEDMAQGQRQVDERDLAIKTGSVAGKVGEDGLYIPESRGIKITSSKR